MSFEVTASADTLLDQAGSTADSYFRNAIRCIDDQFGEGYAKKNPGLIAEFMKTSAMDLQSTALLVSAQKIRDALECIAHTLSEDK